MLAGILRKCPASFGIKTSLIAYPRFSSCLGSVTPPSMSLSTSSSSSTLTESPLIDYRVDNLLCIKLNRPKALNALTLEMCQQMNKLLEQQIDNPESGIAAFLVKSGHPKAFCAGGDIKAVWQEIQDLKAATTAATTTATTAASEGSASVIGTGKMGLLHTDFFRDEYVMNYRLGTTLVPQISVWDGIVMGGGVGLSLFGEFRIATEKTMFAMPETAIGIFPDVGGSSWLPHLLDGCGAYIGLTGVRLGPADLLYTGIATHYISSDKVAELEQVLVSGSSSGSQLSATTATTATATGSSIPLDSHESRKYIKSILDNLQAGSVDITEQSEATGGTEALSGTSTGTSTGARTSKEIACSVPSAETAIILQNADAISHCFGSEVNSVEEIFQRLEALTQQNQQLPVSNPEGEVKDEMKNEERQKEIDVEDQLMKQNVFVSEATAAWAASTLKLLRKMSPTSLKLTFLQLRTGAELDLKACLRMEYRMMMRCLASHDFHEGIRAVLVDKDNKPQWQPAQLADVSETHLEGCFESLGDFDLDVFLPAAKHAAALTTAAAAAKDSAVEEGSAEVVNAAEAAAQKKET